MRFIATSALLGIFAAGSAQAADMDAGAALAEKWCSSCHVVSPDQEMAAQDGVPTFMALADDPTKSTDELAAFMQAPHPPMPDMSLTRREVGDLVAYIESLKTEKE
ncbi:MAG: cytochrome C552 [Rhodospirillaceae bacterium]|nr:cytochrome C552 [Rhodospirillaceae bacterium]